MIFMLWLEVLLRELLLFIVKLPDNLKVTMIQIKCCSQVSSYVEENFWHHQAENVHKLAVYTSDLKHLLSENKQASLSLFLFDKYLQKGV